MCIRDSGITVGRALCGFLTLKFDDTQMVRMGQGIIAIGIAAFLLPLGEAVTLAGLLLAMLMLWLIRRRRAKKQST